MSSLPNLPDEAQAIFAAAPAGVVAGRTFVRRGWSRLEVAAWARLGLCQRELHGVYSSIGPVPPERCLYVPLIYLDLRAPGDHLPALLTAGGALATYGATAFPLPTEPLLLVDPRCTARLDRLPFVISRTGRADVAWERARGLRRTTPSRALADALVLPDVTDRQVRTAVDDIRFHGLMTIPGAVRAWSSMGSHPGACQLLAWANAGVFEQESEGERRAFALLFADHHPVVDCQVVIHGRRRVDFVYLSAAFIIEYYGAVHDGTADEDAVRLNDFEQRGYRTKVVTTTMLRNPGPLAAQIQHIRRDREARIRAGTLALPPLPPQPARFHPLRTLPPSQLITAA